MRILAIAFFAIYSSIALGDELQGTWTSGCNFDSKYFLSTNVTLTFEGDQVHSLLSLYKGEDCKNLQMTENFSGTYRLGEAPIPSDNAPAIDYLISDLVVTIFNQMALDVANEPSVWEHSSCKWNEFGFQLNVPQSVASKEICLHQDWIGQRRYSVVKIDGDNLYMGDGPMTGSSPDSRSTKLSHWFLSRVKPTR